MNIRRKKGKKLREIRNGILEKEEMRKEINKENEEGSM